MLQQRVKHHMKGRTHVIQLMFIKQLPRHCGKPAGAGGNKAVPGASVQVATEIIGNKGRAGGKQQKVRSERQGDGMLSCVHLPRRQSPDFQSNSNVGVAMM